MDQETQLWPYRVYLKGNSFLQVFVPYEDLEQFIEEILRLKEIPNSYLLSCCFDRTGRVIRSCIFVDNIISIDEAYEKVARTVENQENIFRNIKSRVAEKKHTVQRKTIGQVVKRV